MTQQCYRCDILSALDYGYFFFFAIVGWSVLLMYMLIRWSWLMTLTDSVGLVLLYIDYLFVYLESASSDSY